MKVRKINEIASVQVGLILSRKEAENGIEYSRLTLKSIDGGTCIDVNTLDKFYAKEKLESQYITCENDILLRTFAPLSPTLILKEHINYVIPSQMMKITITDKSVLPAYVQCFLAQESISLKLSQEDTGAVRRTIKSSSIANLEIPLPLLEKQKQIAEIYRLSFIKRNLLAKLCEEEKQLCETVMANHFKIGGVK